ncbi:MAG: hypothetical protein H7326_02835 [Bdellovibrionaceae bacterium]|nr:hypothetical protein [Pseudobdellovibrionaceae bacterium]
MLARAFASTILLLATALTAYAAPKIIEGVELKWKATTDLKEVAAANLGAISSSVAIPPFKDSRKVEPMNKVGENTEGKAALPVTTTTDIPQFVTDNVKEIFRKSGLTLAEGKGDYTLNGEIIDYFVSETNMYNGSMTVKLTLLKGDKPIWKGTVVGTNKRFGRSYKLDNYLETLSDLVVDFATKLATNHDFKSQLN